MASSRKLRGIYYKNGFHMASVCNCRICRNANLKMKSNCNANCAMLQGLNCQMLPFGDWECISSMSGENLTCKSSEMTWYAGTSVLTKSRGDQDTTLEVS